MRTLELLAPAKNLECGMAAIDHGADAVYIGATRFGARVAAGNSVDDIRKLADYAHQFCAKVYVTVNTIVFDHELQATFQLLGELSNAGVDAILVQDMAVAEYIKRHPELDMNLHASTQTDNWSVEKVRWLLSQGFSRIVLARELSIAEISDIHQQVPEAELEVFVHGALCVSLSGLCYASHYCFGRSANRGECAQFCRMKFDLLDAEGRVIEQQRHLLSLKDMNQINQLELLIDAGATSFKIEGRLKDLTYVKNVTAAYSEQLNAIIAKYPGRYQRASRGRCTYSFKPDLGKSFNRGYTTYFLKGRQPDIASFDTPKAVGQFVGTVKELRGNSLTVAGTATFANGDGLCFLNEKRELEGFRVNRAEGNRLHLLRMPRFLHKGAALFRNSDQDFEKLLSRPSVVRKIPVQMSLTVTDIGFLLTMDDVSLEFTADHVAAKTLQRDNMVRQLTKLGDTPFDCVQIDIEEASNYFIPSSLLADWRRRIVNKYKQEHCEKHRQRGSNKAAIVPVPFYPLGYLYNIANNVAKAFYQQCGLTDLQPAFELQQPPASSRLLMQCKHCLRYSLGYCMKNGGRRPEWREPLCLRLGDGRRFRLEFDCHHCQMNVYAEER